MRATLISLTCIRTLPSLTSRTCLIEWPLPYTPSNLLDLPGKSLFHEMEKTVRVLPNHREVLTTMIIVIHFLTNLLHFYHFRFVAESTVSRFISAVRPPSPQNSFVVSLLLPVLLPSLIVGAVDALLQLFFRFMILFRLLLDLLC